MSVDSPAFGSREIGVSGSLTSLLLSVCPKVTTPFSSLYDEEERHAGIPRWIGFRGRGFRDTISLGLPLATDVQTCNNEKNQRYGHRT
jgi:hypothetical protein